MKKLRRLRHIFFAHKGNRYRPTLFAKESVVALTLTLFLIESAYILDTALLSKTGFTAAVLPSALTTLANSDRATEGLSSLTRDTALDAVAQAKANDMATKGYFSHNSPDGKTPWYWLQEAGYEYVYAGENLAVDFTDSVDVEKAWMNSPAHRANILKQEYTHIGIAVAQGRYQGKDVTFVAQFFATRPQVEAATIATVSTPSGAEPVPDTVQVEPTVLGAQAAASGDSTLAVISTSPKTTVSYLFIAFATVIAALLTLTLAVHARKKIFYAELLLGGAALIVIALGVLLYNGDGHVGVPSDAQSASAATLFR